VRGKGARAGIRRCSRRCRARRSVGLVYFIALSRSGNHGRSSQRSRPAPAVRPVSSAFATATGHPPLASVGIALALAGVVSASREAGVGDPHAARRAWRWDAMLRVARGFFPGEGPAATPDVPGRRCSSSHNGLQPVAGLLRDLRPPLQCGASTSRALVGIGILRISRERDLRDRDHKGSVSVVVPARSTALDVTSQLSCLGRGHTDLPGAASSPRCSRRS